MIALKFAPPVIAHRGASAYAPENTMAAFTKAVQLGIKWIEFDVMLTADREPIIFHDELLNRTTNGKGDVDHFSYAYLRTLDAGRWFNPTFSGERIPSFQQVIDFIYMTNISANIEIKPLPGDEEQLALRILETLSQFTQPSQSTLLFSSFSFAALRCLRHYAPDCAIGLLLHEWEPGWEDVCTELQCVSIHVNECIMTSAAAHEIKRLGKSLICYTVNDPVRAKELYSLGVDAVFSDAPDRIVW